MTDPLLMLDLFGGLGGASEAMSRRGWEVVRVDNDPAMSPDVVADIREWTWRGRRPTLVWASPPCQEFLYWHLIGKKRRKDPDLSLIHAAMRIVEETRPQWWVLESTHSGIHFLAPLLGPPRQSVGRRIGSARHYLWGDYPPMDPTRDLPRKWGYTQFRPEPPGRPRGLQGSIPSRDWRTDPLYAAERARIPYPVSLALCLAVEQWRGNGEAAP